MVTRHAADASTATSRACSSPCPARRGRTASTRAFFNSQDSLVDRGQRPAAPGEQHADRRARRQPEDRPAAGDHPGGRRARDRQRDDEQLRRGVRPLGRRDHERDAQVGHQRSARAAGSSSATTRTTNAERLLHAPEGADQVRSTAASRSAARSSRTSCSSSATISARSTTPATSSARRCRRWRCATATSARSRSTSTTRSPATSAAPTAWRSPTTRFPQDRISPIAQQAAGVHPAAEHRRRAARPEQLPAGADAREDDRRLRREGQLHAEPEGPDVLPPQLHAAGRVRSRACSASTAARPTAASPAPARTTSFSTAVDWTRVFSTSTVLDVRGGLNYYHNITSTHGRRPDHEHGRRHPRREPRRVHQRPVADQHRRLLAIRCSGSRRASRGTAPRRPGTSRRR